MCEPKYLRCLVLDVQRIQLNLASPIVNTPKENSPLPYHSTMDVVSHCRKYRALWLDAIRFFGMQDHFNTPYQNRHGGASRVRLMQLRDLSEIQRRGR